MRDLYIGSYANQANQGIYKLSNNQISLVTQCHVPTYLVKKDHFIYSVFQDERGCGVMIIDLNNDNYRKKIYSQEQRVSCHIDVNDHIIVTANYHLACVCIYRNQQLHHVIEFDHLSHPHCVKLYNDQLWVVDLGLDCIYVYDINTYQRIKTLIAPQGAGIRHIVQQDNITYAITEYSAQLLKYEDDSLVDVINLANDLFDQQGSAIRIYQHHLYTCNRLSNVIYEISLSTFSVIREIVLPKGHCRDFDIIEDTLIICNMNSNQVLLMDLNTLKIKNEYSIYKPSCIAI